MKSIALIFLFPFCLLSQEVLIKQLPEAINTNNAELNFIKINDTTAYFTVASEKGETLESNIYVATFKNGEWGNKKYSSFNSEIFNTANISFESQGKTFFSICNMQMLDCKIVYLDKDKKQGFYEIPPISSSSSFNTQGFICSHDGQDVLYFVSDRVGGFGGLDIWLSVIDNDGNFGVPINAGPKINTSYDEITPFYNQYERTMYYSSNRKGGAGAFDIYKSLGKLNLWKNSVNVLELNTDKDELYITFYDEKNGYFSSNRKGAKSKGLDYCCNDIYSFEYLDTPFDTKSIINQVLNYLPLSLYFHNDEPDPRSISRRTTQTYKDVYISYLLQKPEYEKQNPKSKSFFENVLKKNFSDLNKVLEMLLFDLSKGKSVELQIKGYASPLYNSQYNQNLSQRRIVSFINYLTQFDNGSLKDYILAKKLIVNELSFGESNASNKVSDDARNKKKSVYSIEAMQERKIEIVDVILEK